MSNETFNELRQETLEYHEFRSNLDADTKSFFESVYQDMHTLDAKSTGLITFITLALAALTFALSLVDQNLVHATLVKSGIICFIGIFSLAAWFSLRCLDITGPPFTKVPRNPEEHKQNAATEIAARRYNYFVSLKITRGAFLMLVPLVAIWLGLILKASY